MLWKGSVNAGPRTHKKCFKIIYRQDNCKILSEKEIKKVNPFTMASKRTKYSGIYLTKEVKNLYTENCKTMMKEIK